MPLKLSSLLRAARWATPSFSAACAGGLVAAIIDGLGAPGTIALGAGFVVVLVVPILLAISIAGRALYAGWQTPELASAIVGPDGSAPRLAAWLVVIAVDALVLGVALMIGTAWFATHSAFTPLPVSYFEATLAAVLAVALAALSRPMAALATLAIAPLARRAPRAFRPRAIVVTLAALVIAAGIAVWFSIVLPSLGAFDTSVIDAPLAAAIAFGLVHATWSRWGRARAVASWAIVAIAGAAAASALVVARVAPAATLELWGDRAIAGLAIDRAFDLDTIRDAIPLATFAPVPRPGADHPDIILVTIDTVRADHTPPYGGHADMPTLAALADRGAVFDWAFSPSNVTRRSIPAMITGIGADRVRGRVVSWALRVDPRHVLLAERLHAAGYDTAGFMCCESFWGPELHTGLSRGLEHLEIEHDGAKLAKRARAWLEQRAKHPTDHPLFLWIHILEPHNWNANGDPPVNERDHIYDHVLAQCDAMLADVLAFAKGAIVIVTADHGEGLGEHGHLNHSTDLYDSQIHVPLVLAGPHVGKLRIAETVSTTNLVPSVLELAGFAPPTGRAIDGASFADLATGARASRTDGQAFAAMIKDRSNPGGLTALVDGSWKIIDDGNRLELYDLASDPDEHTDLAKREPAKLAELRVQLRARQQAGRVSPFE